MSYRSARNILAWAKRANDGKVSPTTQELNHNIRRCAVLLDNADADVRRRAAWALASIAALSHADVAGCMVPVLPDMLRGLVACLGDANVAVRQNAAWALARIAALSHADVAGCMVSMLPDMLRGLVTCLGDANVDVRSNAA